MDFYHLWKYSIWPRFTNIFRRAHFRLFVARHREEQRREQARRGHQFYEDGVTHPEFREWWKKNSNTHKGLLKYHIKAIRDFLKENK